MRKGMALSHHNMFLWAFASLFIIPSTFSLTPINIAGVFNPYTANGVLDNDQLQHLSVFMAAVDEINRKQEILPGYELKYIVRNAHTFAGAALTASDIATNNYGIAGVVTALPYDETAALNQMLEHYEIVTVHSVAMDTDLGDGAKYPFKVQTPPIESYQGMVLQNIVCNYLNASRIAIFAANDDFGTKSSMEAGNGAYCDMNKLATYLFEYSLTDFTSIIENALNLDATIFVLLCGPANAAAILEQGYNLGLFHEGTQIIGARFLLTSEIYEYFSADADVPAIMKGFIGIEFWPDYSTHYTSRGQQFLSLLRNESETITRCNQFVDITNTSFLYFNGNSSSGVCHGLNFSDYLSLNSKVTLSAYASLTYDATYLLAHGIQSVITSGQPINGRNILSNLFNNVSFVGASGLVEVFEGMPEFAYYGFGDREVGHHYKLMNFHQEGYKNNVDESFALVGVWSVENGVKNCYFHPECSSISTNLPFNQLTDGYPLFTFDNPPNIVKIGGIFSPINSEGVVDKVQAENLAAFLQAVSEINDKNDGVLDWLLPNTQLKVSVRSGNGNLEAINAAEEIMSSFYYTGVHIAVNGMQDTEALASMSLLVQYEIIQAQSMASDTTFADSVLYPYRVQTSPLTSYQVMVLQSLLCSRFNQRKVAVFHENSYTGLEALQELQDDTYCPITPIITISIDASQSSVESAVSSAKSSGALVFLVLVESETEIVAALLRQGYNDGLFGQKGTQIYLQSAFLNENLLNHFQSMSSSDIISMMTGVIGVEYWSDYWITRTTEGQDFLKRWKAQSPTNGMMTPTGFMKCNLGMDDTGSFLYRSADGLICSGLNFSSYSLSSTTSTGEVVINPYAAHTYDVTTLIAYGLHELFEISHKQFSTAELNKILINNVTFNGTTGLIDVFEGMTDSHETGRGSREEGYVYKIMNFNAQKFKENVNSSFVQVGYWINHAFEDCDDYMGCSSVVYNTIDNQIPADTPSPIYVKLPGPLRGLMISLGCLLVIVSISFIGIVIIRRQHKIIKASQPGMTLLILIGLLFAALRVINTGFDINDQTCNSGLWFAHLAFALVFGSLALKTWRVHRIVNNPSLKRIKITEATILQYMAVFLGIMIVYLLVLTFVGHPQRQLNGSTVDNQTTYTISCSYDIPAVLYGWFGVDGVLLLLALRLSFAVKSVPDSINECKSITSVITMVSVLSSICLALVFFVNLEPNHNQVITTLSFAIGSFHIIVVYLLPKIIPILKEEYQIYRHKNRKVHIASTTPTDANSNLNGTINPCETAVVASNAVFKHKSIDEKTKICIEQIGKWQALLLQLSEEGASSLASRALPSSFTNRDAVPANRSYVKSHLDNISEMEGHSVPLQNRPLPRRQSNQNIINPV